MSNRLLAITASELESRAGTSTSTNETESGYWKRIAAAAESLAGATSTANDNTNGYILRTAVALESLTGTSGAEENPGPFGLTKRVVDALESLAGGPSVGSLEQRLSVGATNAVFSGYTFVNAEAEALVARMETEPDDTRKAAIDTLVGDLKAASLWSTAKLPLLYVTWAHTEQAALLNWTQDLHNAINGLGAVFTPDEGFSGNSLSTGTNLAANGASQNDLHAGVFTITDNATVANDLIGAAAVQVRASSAPAGRANAAALLAVSPAGSAPHHIVAVRRDASDHHVFRNGGSKTTLTTASAALGTSTCNFGNSTSGRATGIAHYGPALSDAEIAALYTAFEAYRVAIQGA